MSKTLITGGCGFIGANLIRLMAERGGGGDLVVLDNEVNGRPQDLPPAPLAYVKGDIRDAGSVSRACVGCDTIIHLAADGRVVDSIADPAANFEVNVRGSLNVLLAARDAGVRHVVMASTGGAILGDTEPPVHEGLIARPAAPYGASKLAAEGYGHAFAASFGMRVTMLRFSNVYGPLSMRKQSAVAHFFKQVLAGRPITVFGDGSQVRDFVYVHDLCRGIVQAIEAKAEGVFQLGSGRPTRIDELLREMQAITGSQRWPEIRYAPWRAGEVRRTWCDISKSATAFGFRPATPLAEGLKATWQWFASQVPEGATERQGAH